MIWRIMGIAMVIACLFRVGLAFYDGNSSAVVGWMVAFFGWLLLVTRKELW